jgi:hypothetical protein
MDGPDDFPNAQLVDYMPDFQLVRESSKQFLRSWDHYNGGLRQSRDGSSDKPDKVSNIVNKEPKQGSRK